MSTATATPQSVTRSRGRTQGRGLEAGTEVEAMEDQCLLTFSTRFTRSVYKLHGHLPTDHTSQTGLDGLVSITN